MTTTLQYAIVCEDIRDEIGNKKSLMGVMPGDILVPTFPATIKIAFFLVYRTDETKLSALARIIQDGEEVAKAEFDATVIDPKDPWVVILPMALATFERKPLCSC